MFRLTAAALTLLLSAPLVQAQSIGEPIPGQGGAIAKDRFKPQKAERPARACPEYGQGFVRVEGSSLCVRAGGAVRAEFGKSSRNGYGSSAEGMVQLEGRSESSLGPVRTVVRMRGQVDRGLETGPFRN